MQCGSSTGASAETMRGHQRRGLGRFADGASTQPRRQLQIVPAFLRLDAEAPPKSMRVTLNTASLVRRNLQDLANDSVLGGREQLPQLAGHLPKQVSDASLSTATVKARRKVERVVLQNLQRQQKRAQQGSSRSAPATQQQQQQLNSPADVIMELVLEGNAVADFAGVLTLLLECGQHEEQVIAAGSVLLNARDGAAAKRRAQPGMQDVVLCVALAHAQLAQKCMGREDTPLTMGDAGPMLHPLSTIEDLRLAAQTPSAKTLEEAYGHVSEALRLLKEHGAATSNLAAGSASLRQQLLDMLLRVAPMHAGHLLGTLPLEGPWKPANNKQRSRAVEVVKSSLWQLEDASQRLELLGQVRPWLTAGEQVTLYDDAPVPDAELSEQELYDTALACIWQGYTQRWPHHVYRADTLLSVISRRQDLDVDVTLERSVCALLLGKQSEAQGQLVAARAAYTFATATTDGEEGSEAEAGRLGKGADGRMGQGGGKGSKKLLPQSQQRSGDGKRQSRYEQLQLGAEDSAFVVMESSDNLQEDVSALENWAERWLEMAVMPVFSSQQVPLQSPALASQGSSPGAEPPAVSVSSYLSSPKVAVFNQVLRYANEQNLRHVTENLQHLSHDSLQQLLGLWRSGTTNFAQTVMRRSQEQQVQAVPQQQKAPAAAVVLPSGGNAEAAVLAAKGNKEEAALLADGGAVVAAGMPLPSSSGSPPSEGKPVLGAASNSDGDVSSAAVEMSNVGPVLEAASEAGKAQASIGEGPVGWPGINGTMGSVYGSVGTLASAYGSMGTLASAYGIGERSSDGEDVVGMEALPWVQMQKDEKAAGAAKARGQGQKQEEEDVRERVLRSRVSVGKVDGGTVDHASWSFDGEEDGGALWVLGPQGIIRPRMTARIVDPTNGRNAGGVVPQVAGGGVQGTIARAVGLTAVVVAVVAGTMAVAMGAQRTRVGFVDASQAVVVPTAQQQEQKQGQQKQGRSFWRFWRR